MVRAPRVTAREIIAVLEKKGFVCDRQHGSHAIYIHVLGMRVTVPSHAGKILHPKVLKSILNDAEITLEELRSLL